MINRISGTIYGQIKHCLVVTVSCIGKMVKIGMKKFLKTTLLQLLWFLLVLIVVYMVWWTDDIEVVNVPKANKYPVMLWWTKEFPATSELIHCSGDVKCHVFSDRKKDKHHMIEAYLFYASTIEFYDLPLPRRPTDIIWGLFHEESPRNVEELLHEQALNLFNLSSTFSRYSDVPFPLLHLHNFHDITSTKYFVNTTTKNEFLKNIAPILYLQSDCDTSTERDTYVMELMNFIEVDSYGSCLNNKDMPERFKENYLNNLHEDGFLKFIARYKFVIAIENGVCNDYVTEKFWRAIKVGSVPIYFGSPSIRDWIPNNKSAILLQDYPTPKILSEYIRTLLNNDTLYEEHLEHKTKQNIDNEMLKNELRIRPYQVDVLKTVRLFECTICKKLHDNVDRENYVSVVNKSHYDCPKPISALSLSVNPHNNWVLSWKSAETKAKVLYKTIIEGN